MEQPLPDGEHTHSLRDLLRPVVSRWPLVLAIMIIGTSATYAWFNRQPNRYTASTKVFFQDSGVAQLLNPNASQDPDRALLNQATLLSSRDVAASVARRLGFRGDPGSLLNDIRARPSAGSDFILITAELGTAANAAVVANAFAEAFIEIRSADLRDAIAKQLRVNRQQLRSLSPTPQNQEERNSIASTIRQLELAQAIPGGSARQIDPALPPAAPTSPRPVRDAIFALVLSALLGIGLALVLNRFDRRLRRLTDIEEAFGLPLLAVVPTSSRLGTLVKGYPTLSADVREAFRGLRTALLLASVDRPLRRILVTSAIAGEGKSSVVRNLALAFQEAGESVAVADLDLRRPRQATLFGIEAGPGFTEVLTGDASLDSGLKRLSPVAEGVGALAGARSNVNTMTREFDPQSNGAGGSLDLLPSGRSPANPQALLGTARARSVISELSDRHGLLIIDSSPYLIVSDAAAIATEVDAVIVVARVGISTVDSSRRLVNLLSRTPGAAVLGVVANDVREHAGYYEYAR